MKNNILVILKALAFLPSFIGILAAAGCGVKADPLPPLTPAEIGRGKPVYKGEDDGNSPAAVPKVYETEKKQEDENESKH